MKIKRDIQEDVIFRVFRKGGGIIAFWPAVKVDFYGYVLTCQSYQHVGQHGAADYQYCLALTRLATPKEYKDLLKELKGRGYTPHIIQRVTKQHEDFRKKSC
jgi:hypothetical protein